MVSPRTSNGEVRKQPARRRILRYVWIIGSIVVLGLIAFVATTTHRVLTVVIPNAYAMEWVGAILVDYLREHEDRWPASWDDLRPTYERHAVAAGRPWTMEELQSRVRVRWDVNVDEVRRMDKPPHDLVVLRDGRTDHMRDYDPNEMVYEYLTSSRPPEADTSHSPSAE